MRVAIVLSFNGVFMKKHFISLINALYYLVSGAQDEEPGFKSKLRVVLAWFFIILFCLAMLKLFV